MLSWEGQARPPHWLKSWYPTAIVIQIMWIVQLYCLMINLSRDTNTKINYRFTSFHTENSSQKTPAPSCQPPISHSHCHVSNNSNPEQLTSKISNQISKPSDFYDPIVKYIKFSNFPLLSIFLIISFTILL